MIGAELSPHMSVPVPVRVATRPQPGSHRRVPHTPFFADVMMLRRRIRRHTRQRVPASRRVDRETVINLLNEVLAIEVACVLRYKRHYFAASGAKTIGLAEKYLRCVHEEQSHVDWIAQRIVELGGSPNFLPSGLMTEAYMTFDAGQSIVDMAKEDCVAERLVIDSYVEIVRFLGDADPGSRRLLQAIIDMEVEHLDGLAAQLTEHGIEGAVALADIRHLLPRKPAIIC